VNQKVDIKTIISGLVVLGAGFVVVKFLPLLFRGWDRPPEYMFYLIAIVMMAIVAYALYISVRATTRLSGRVLVFFILYHLAIVAAKFAIAPINAYQLNSKEAFDATTFDYNSAGNYIFTGIAIFLLYLLVLRIIYTHFRKPTANLISSTASNSRPTNKRPAVRPVFLAVLLLPLLVFGGVGILELPAFLAFNSIVPYLTIAFGISLVVSVAAALIFAILAFNEASRQAVLMRDASVLSSMFVASVTMLVVLQVLWLVFMSVLVTIWPFDTVSSK
jgi:hypothetical protein